MGLFDNMGGDIDWATLLGNPAATTGTPMDAPNFADRFKGQAGPPLPPSMISPELMAKNFAARGVPPPPMDLPVQMDVPPDTSTEPTRLLGSTFGDSGGRGEELTGMASRPGSVGAALTGNDAPMMADGSPEKSPGAPQNIVPPGAAEGEKKPGSLMDALRGVKAPANPEVQRVSSPSAPRQTPIKGGELLALMQLLNSAPGASEYKLPSTLGAALRK